MGRRSCTLVLAVALVFALCAGAWASIGADVEITGFSESFGDGGYTVNGTQKRYSNLDDLAALSGTAPGTVIFLPLRVRDFTWKGNSQLPLVEKHLHTLGIELWVDIERGSQLIDTIELGAKDGSVGLLIEFTDELFSLEEEEFRVKAAFQAGGEEYPFEINGTMRNTNRYVFGATKTVQLGIGRMATGYENCTGVKFDLGAGVTITSDIGFGEEAYGAAREGARDEHDFALMEAHPQIVQCIHLNVVNLSGNVRIDTNGLGVLHVYNDQLVYLGTTAGPVRQEYQYYLATTRI